MANEEKILTDEQRTAVQQLQRALSLLPIENPFEYVKSIQKDFDGSKIQYSDEYYEVTGIENPKGTNTQDKHLVEFEPVVFEFNRKLEIIHINHNNSGISRPHFYLFLKIQTIINSGQDILI